jgi:sulfur relay (sulfurtransferase) complex TusBCD TusD component (DsrE family)
VSAHPHPLAGRELAIVVSTPPERGDVERATRLARAARELGAEVGMFFMHGAVAGLPAARDTLAALAEDGVEIVACATSAEAFGVSADGLPCTLGSQDDHAALVHRAERVVALT